MRADELPDEPDRWIERAAAGDRDAAERLLARCLPTLRAFLRLQTGAVIRRNESLSDLVQSVCRRALADLPKLEQRTEESFRKRVFAIARHLLVDRARYYATRDAICRSQADPSWSTPDPELLGAYGPLVDPSMHAEMREQLERVERAMARLSQRDRDVITWSKIAGWSHAEIAAELGVAPGSVPVILYRALARLAEWLGE